MKHKGSPCVNVLPVAVFLACFYMNLVFHSNSGCGVKPVTRIKACISWRWWWGWRRNIDSMTWRKLRLRNSLLLGLLGLHCSKLLWGYSWGKLNLLLWGRNPWCHTDLLLLRNLSKLLLLRRWDSWCHTHLLLRWRYTGCKSLSLLWLLDKLLSTWWWCKLLLLRRRWWLSNLLLRRWRLVELLLLWRWWLINLLLLRWWLIELLLLLWWWWRLIKLLLLL